MTEEREASVVTERISQGAVFDLESDGLPVMIPFSSESEVTFKSPGQVRKIEKEKEKVAAKETEEGRKKKKKEDLRQEKIKRDERVRQRDQYAKDMKKLKEEEMGQKRIKQQSWRAARNESKRALLEKSKLEKEAKRALEEASKMKAAKEREEKEKKEKKKRKEAEMRRNLEAFLANEKREDRVATGAAWEESSDSDPFQLQDPEDEGKGQGQARDEQPRSTRVIWNSSQPTSWLRGHQWVDNEWIEVVRPRFSNRSPAGVNNRWMGAPTRPGMSISTGH